MSCFIVRELEEQRKELEARRAMLEERYKLRVATAQEFGVIHARRLDRVRDAFVKQCDAARRRNQDVVAKVCLSKEVLFGGNVACKASTSRNRLAAQLDRFLSVAEKLYPAWQEEQLRKNAMKLHVLEEERFAAEQRRRAAQDRFRQEQAITVAVQERRRRLATERIHERNDADLRRSLREHSTAQAQHEGQIMLQHAIQAGRVARHEAETMLRQHASRKCCDGQCISGEIESDGGKKFVGHASVGGDTKDECPRAVGASGTGASSTLATRLDDNPMRAKKSYGRDISSTGVLQPADPVDALEPAGGRSEEGERTERGGGCGTRHDVCPRDGGRDPGVCHSLKTTTRMGNHENLPSSSPRSRNEGAAAVARVAASVRRSCLSTDVSLVVPPSVEAEEFSQAHNRAIPTRSQASVPEFELPYPPPPGDARPSNQASRRESISSSASANGLLDHVDEAKRLEKQSDGGGEYKPNQAGIWDASQTGSHRAAAAAVAATTATVSWSDVDGNGDSDHIQYQEHREQRDFDPFEDFAVQKRSRAFDKRTETNRAIKNTGDVVDTNKVGNSDARGSPNDHHRSATGATASADDSPPIADADKPLSLPTAARALAALTLSVESLADDEAANFPAGAGPGSPSAFSILVDTYASATTAAPLSSVRAAVNKATAEASPASADASTLVSHKRTGKHDPSARRNTGSVALKSFGLSTLCGAVLNLTTTYAGDILPVEMLSGLVTAGKVRARHRQRSPAGTLRLFDTLFTHVRRLGATGEIEPATIARLFVPCFAGAECKVPSGRGDRCGGVGPDQRLRRKVSFLLEATADPNGPVPSPALPFGATVPAGAGIPSARGDGGDGGGSCTIGVGKTSNTDTRSDIEGDITAYDEAPSQRESSLKKSSRNREAFPDSRARRRTGSSHCDPPPVQKPQPLVPSFLPHAVEGQGATGGAKRRGSGSTAMASSGVLLGGSNRAVKKGMLDMSAMMVAAGGVSSVANYSLSEFEMDQSLDDTF